MIKKIQISDELFWGFNKNINLNNFNSLKEIADYIKKELIIFLKNNNLFNLEQYALKLNLHNHQFNTYDELYKTNDDIIYFCGSCCL
jgi:hypothetical protein